MSDNTMSYNVDEETEEMFEELVDEAEDKANEDEEENVEPIIHDLSKFLDWELVKCEPDRRNLEFTLRGDDSEYQGKVLKKLDTSTFIFAINKPEKKLKKIKLDLIENFG